MELCDIIWSILWIICLTQSICLVGRKKTKFVKSKSTEVRKEEKRIPDAREEREKEKTIFEDNSGKVYREVPKQMPKEDCRKLLSILLPHRRVYDQFSPEFCHPKADVWSYVTYAMNEDLPYNYPTTTLANKLKNCTDALEVALRAKNLGKLYDISWFEYFSSFLPFIKGRTPAEEELFFCQLEQHYKEYSQYLLTKFAREEEAREAARKREERKAEKRRLKNFK